MIFEWQHEKGPEYDTSKNNTNSGRGPQRNTWNRVEQIHDHLLGIIHIFISITISMGDNFPAALCATLLLPKIHPSEGGSTILQISTSTWSSTWYESNICSVRLCRITWKRRQWASKVPSKIYVFQTEISIEASCSTQKQWGLALSPGSLSTASINLWHRLHGRNYPSGWWPALIGVSVVPIRYIFVAYGWDSLHGHLSFPSPHDFTMPAESSKSSPDRISRTLVLCFDGTANQFGRYVCPFLSCRQWLLTFITRKQTYWRYMTYSERINR
jgi:hypothetical protein